MAETAPHEPRLREALHRLDRHERRIELLESAAFGPVPMAQPASAAETPMETAWPTLDLRPPPAADRLADLEARLGRAEERLHAAARLETVGRLVAGVAHDFNNLLTVVAGAAELIRGNLPTGHQLAEAADLIAATVQTAANVSRQLVHFARPTRSDPCPVDANAAVRAVERTLRRLTGERVALDFLPAPALPLILADPGQFDQVLLNLLVNARDAITGDGRITIRTARADPGGRAADGPGGYVAVTVTDTGAGMTEEVRSRVFDPFFTTKPEGGTGLGMSTVRDILLAAGGTIEVDSAPGWGTSVRVYWPVYPDTADTFRLIR